MDSSAIMCTTGLKLHDQEGDVLATPKLEVRRVKPTFRGGCTWHCISAGTDW
jgi:hypothetical protein